MQDRFRYRVFDNDDKKMHDVIFLNYENNSVEWYNDKNKKRAAFIKEVPTVQCTSLKDKNDKLIYEGDILKYTSKPTNTQKNNPEYKPFAENYSVVWEDFYTGYNLRSKEKVNCFNLGIMTKDCEVIGNIYENPELLEQL